ncbi:hypothetical protein CHS0354_011046 [Potamilus streckersoni]|uniref:Uncharacterized protein n=1 Tax=Potamilus streckersoni TaxID=2493646 RepID=A0AAE0WEI1_9BIVA|nr:hypothetical protein CHS0354_011046 [Potamilus streckersoni]
MGCSVVARYWRQVRAVLHRQRTLPASQVLPLYREPGVLWGYRMYDKSLFYYIISIFQINNETVNIWTHLVAILLFLKKIWNLADEFHFYSDPESWPLLGFGICCLAYAILSVSAHTIHSKSPFIHYTCFQADYAGIGYYGIGIGIIVFYSSSHPGWFQFLSRVYMPLNVFLGWVVMLGCSMAKLRYKRPYPFRRKLLQLCSGGMHAILVVLPLQARYTECFRKTDCSLSSLNHHTEVFLVLFSSLFFFSSHFPEKMWPGKFDLLGQGHQIFHVLATITTLKQFDAAYIDITKHRHTLITDKADMFEIVLSIILFAFISIITILVLRPIVKQRVLQDLKDM